jgi:hypothetical protein
MGNICVRREACKHVLSGFKKIYCKTHKNTSDERMCYDELKFKQWVRANGIVLLDVGQYYDLLIVKSEDSSLV